MKNPNKEKMELLEMELHGAGVQRAPVVAIPPPHGRTSRDTNISVHFFNASDQTPDRPPTGTEEFPDDARSASAADAAPAAGQIGGWITISIPQPPPRSKVSGGAAPGQRPTSTHRLRVLCSDLKAGLHPPLLLGGGSSSSPVVGAPTSMCRVGTSPVVVAAHFDLLKLRCHDLLKFATPLVVGVDFEFPDFDAELFECVLDFVYHGSCYPPKSTCA